jgi:RHS repeat-associated protein
VVNYLYDDNGNRLSKIAQFTPAGSEPKLKESYYTYDTASNRLIKTQANATSQNLSYDKMGSVINDGQHRYLYDGHERLIQINQLDNVRLARYVLNGLGQRVRKLTASGEVRFVYDDAGHVLGEYTNAGKVIQETVYLGDTPVAVMTGSAVSYIYTDHLNAPRVITDSAGKAIWQWDADPFGVTLANADPDGDGVKFVYNLRFPGQYFDSETRLHYNYFRDYNPRTGRYIESDPIGLAGGLNTYGYVGGNPVSFVDPLGLVNIGPGHLNNELGFGGSGLGGASIGGGAGRIKPANCPPPNLSPKGAGRNGAFNEAKRQSNIPTSQQPSKVSPNIDRRGNSQSGRTYEYEVPAKGGGTQTVTICDDAGGHDFGPGNPQNRGPHFNDEAGNHYDY